MYDDTYYKPGGPVFLLVGGEVFIEYWTFVLQEGLFQILMQQFNGLGVILEGRYYGPNATYGSWPFNTSTTDNLIYQTTEQTLADYPNFARNVQLPGGPQKINAPDTPWFVYGASLAGAQAAFIMKLYDDTFAGGIASSGVISAQVDYPQWYDPIQLIGAQDCVASINDIVDKIDVLVNKNETDAIQQLKEIFGLGALTDIRDFAATIAFPLGGPGNYPTYSYQEVNWNPEFGSQDFFYFCRNVSDVNPPANNTAADNQLAKYTNNEAWTNLGKVDSSFESRLTKLQQATTQPTSSALSSHYAPAATITVWRASARAIPQNGQSQATAYSGATCTQSAQSSAPTRRPNPWARSRCYRAWSAPAIRKPCAAGPSPMASTTASLLRRTLRAGINTAR